MKNLLPMFERKKVSREFLARFAVAALIVVGVAEAVLIALVAPSYFLSRSRVEAALRERDSIQKLSPTQDPVIASFLASTRAKIDAGVANEPPGAMSTTLGRLVAAKVAGIRLQAFKSESRGKGSSVVTVSGMAADRDALLRFKESIEKDASWDSVVLPVSSFAKDRDINFTIQFSESDTAQ